MGLKFFFNGNPDKLETADGVENSIVIQGTQPINTFFYHAGPRKRQIKMLKSKMQLKSMSRPLRFLDLNLRVGMVLIV